MTLAPKEMIAQLRARMMMHAFVHHHLPDDSPSKRPRIALPSYRDRNPDGSPEAIAAINAAAQKRIARQRKVLDRMHGSG